MSLWASEINKAQRTKLGHNVRPRQDKSGQLRKGKKMQGYTSR